MSELREGTVIVGVRYRLSVLGFLALDELSARDPKRVSGNYGFSDQVTPPQPTTQNAMEGWENRCARLRFAANECRKSVNLAWAVRGRGTVAKRSAWAAASS